MPVIQKMLSTEYLKQLVSNRLAAAAEDIVAVFCKSILEYEEELERHRKLFDMALKPVVKLRRTELPQQDWNFSVDQEEPQPPQVKEQPEELSISEFALKEEPGDLQLCCADVKNNKSENPTVDWNPERPLQESEVKIPVVAFVVSEANSNLPLSQSQELTDNKYENSSPTRFGKNVFQINDLKMRKKNHAAQKTFVCLTCGKRFTRKSHFKEHERTHTGEKPYACQKCNKRFAVKKSLRKHMTIHTGQKPYVCQTCGEGFMEKIFLKCHARRHTGNDQLCSDTVEKKSRDPAVDWHPNESIEQSEIQSPVLISVVTEVAQKKGEHECSNNVLVCETDCCELSDPEPLLGDKTVQKPHVCDQCGKSFTRKGSLIDHKRVHTGEKPFVCQTCGKAFAQKSNRNQHSRLHTGEKPIKCKECGKGFVSSGALRYHVASTH